MRAAVIDEHGASPRIADVPRPKLMTGQTLVAVKAATLNPLDTAFSADRHTVVPMRFPYVPGFEGVGEVVESAKLAVGQRVRFECRPTFSQGGSFAEYAVVADDWAFALPDQIPGGTAAALGMVGITVWTALEWRAALKKGESVLVLGATGATGHMAVQAARLMGAGRVVAAGRDPEALSRTVELGAHATVDLGRQWSTPELAQAFRDAAGGPLDVILDALWGQASIAALHASGRTARMINYGGAASETAEVPSALIRFLGISILGHNSMLPPREIVADAYQRIVEHAIQGDLNIDYQEMPLDEIARAWEESSSTHRKLVLIP